jgi:hypothetical protein
VRRVLSAPVPTPSRDYGGALKHSRSELPSAEPFRGSHGALPEVRCVANVREVLRCTVGAASA